MKLLTHAPLLSSFRDGARAGNVSLPLPFAIVLSLALHGVLLAVTFLPAPPAPEFQDRNLEVVLVNARRERAPEQADVLAQANLDGGGTSEEASRPSTPAAPNESRVESPAEIEARRPAPPPAPEALALRNPTPEPTPAPTPAPEAAPEPESIAAPAPSPEALPAARQETSTIALREPVAEPEPVRDEPTRQTFIAEIRPLPMPPEAVPPDPVLPDPEPREPKRVAIEMNAPPPRENLPEARASVPDKPAPVASPARRPEVLTAPSQPARPAAPESPAVKTDPVPAPARPAPRDESEPPTTSPDRAVVATKPPPAADTRSMPARTPRAAASASEPEPAASVASATPEPSPPTPAAEQAEPPPPEVSGLDLMDSIANIARIEAQIDRRLDEYAKRPRKAQIGARAREHRFAQYVEDWRQKVERIGTLNYPEAARGRIYGTLVLTVAIRVDGTVENIEIDRSSGHDVLDQAAISIVRMAAPYSPFPPDIRVDTDIIEITRTWSFTNSDQLRTR